MTKYSLKSKITRSVALLFTIFWILTASILYSIVDNTITRMSYEEIEIEAEFMAQLYELTLAQRDQVRDQKNIDVQLISSNRAENINRNVQVWHNDVLIAETIDAPPFHPPFEEGAEHIRFRSDSDETIVWFHKSPSADLWVIISQDVDTISFGNFQPLIPILFLLVFLLPVVILILNMITTRLFNPLTILADQIRVRSTQDIGAISQENIPEELDPIVSSLNSLIQTQEMAIKETGRILDQEKRFTVNAAHELLTPLVAIKSEVQQQIREAIDGTGPDQAMQKALLEIKDRVDRAVHTVEQLVTLARLEPQTAYQKFENVQLTAQVQITVANLANKIEENNIEINLDETPVTIRAIPSAINILCRNVIDNAIRYTPEGGKISISITEQNNLATLSIYNDTPSPIPDYLLESIFERFVRGAHATETGSGLGLSIVKRIAEIHGTTANLDNISRGVEFSISFSTNA